jgi:hypothetical protein
VVEPIERSGAMLQSRVIVNVLLRTSLSPQRRRRREVDQVALSAVGARPMRDVGLLIEKEDLGSCADRCESVEDSQRAIRIRLR